MTLEARWAAESRVKKAIHDAFVFVHALGPAVPPDDASKASLLQTLLATFCRDFSGALVEKRADVKTGRKIKDAFVALQV